MGIPHFGFDQVVKPRRFLQEASVPTPFDIAFLWQLCLCRVRAQGDVARDLRNKRFPKKPTNEQPTYEGTLRTTTRMHGSFRNQAPPIPKDLGRSLRGHLKDDDAMMM